MPGTFISGVAEVDLEIGVANLLTVGRHTQEQCERDSRAHVPAAA